MQKLSNEEVLFQINHVLYNSERTTADNQVGALRPNVPRGVTRINKQGLSFTPQLVPIKGLTRFV